MSQIEFYANDKVTYKNNEQELSVVIKAVRRNPETKEIEYMVQTPPKSVIQLRTITTGKHLVESALYTE
jgi:hypothetical protein